jgi:vesicle coat complex subunit
MHATGAIGALSFALDDVDPDVQHEAVMGLAEIAHQEEWAPTAETFRMDRQRYVTYWKNWAQAR